MLSVGIVQHALGLDQYGRGTMFRNHFIAGPRHHERDKLEMLVSAGIMQKREGLSPALLGGESEECFFVTPSGIEWVKANSPKPPKLTRAQKRYLQWLEVRDCFDSFRDFLRYESHRTRRGGKAGLA